MGQRIRLWKKSDGSFKREFDGFVDDECSIMEDIIQIFQRRMGVKTDVEHTDIKQRRDRQKLAEKDRETN